MNECGEKVIKEILFLLNNGWERTGTGCYIRDGVEYTRADAIQIQRGSSGPLEICEGCAGE